MANEITQAKPQGIATWLANPKVKENVVSVVGDKDAQRFISSIVSAVQTNPTLAECTNTSILNAALLGQSLGLPQSPQLAFFYFVPYNNNKKDANGRTHQVKEATFQMSWKGYVQLAMRSGQYKKLNVTDIREGELVSYNPITEEITFDAETDFAKRESLPVIGYYAMFELKNGFSKFIYWSKAQMEAHANKYSKSYQSDKKYNAKKSFWTTDFDAMAKKTVIRQLISKYGVMSVEMQTAYTSDMAVIGEDGKPDYVDNKPQIAPATDVYTESVVADVEATEKDWFDATDDEITAQANEVFK